MKRRFAAADLRGKRVHWLVDIDLGGRTYHLSTEDLDVSSDDGDIHYDGVLDDVSFQLSMDLFQVSESNAVELRATLEGMADILRAGRNLRGRGEASRWVAGTTYEQRVKKLVGYVRDPVVLDDGIECSIVAELLDDTGSIPETTARVDASTWSSVPTYVGEDDVGLDYPVIIGQPGRTRFAFAGWMSGSQALWLDKRRSDHRLLLAGHRVQCSQVMLIHDDMTGGRRFSVTHATDARGRTVAIVDTGSNSDSYTSDDLAPPSYDAYYPHLGAFNGTGSFEDSDMEVLNPGVDTIANVWVGWYDLTNPDAGGAIDASGNLIRAAGDVIRFVLGYSTVKVDDGAFGGVAPLLAGFKIDAVIESRVKPWEWVQDNLLPLLPVSLVIGPWGVRPILFRWDAAPSDAVAHFNEDLGDVEFDEQIEIDTQHIRNKFSLDYGWNMRTQKYSYTSRVDAEYEESTAYAIGRLVADNGPLSQEWIDITSKVAGSAGCYRVTLNNSGANPPTSNYTASTRTVGIGYLDGTATTAQIENEILTGTASSYIECEDTDGTTVWLNPEHPTNAEQTLILPDEGTAGSLHCAISQARYKDLEQNQTGIFEEALESAVLYDPNTAALVLQWKAATFALEHRRVIVTAPTDWEWLDVGDVVLLTCDRLSLDSDLAHIEQVEIHDDGLVHFVCLLIEDPVRHDVL